MWLTTRARRAAVSVQWPLIVLGKSYRILISGDAGDQVFLKESFEKQITWQQAPDFEVAE